MNSNENECNPGKSYGIPCNKNGQSILLGEFATDKYFTIKEIEIY
jgi:hypothetical protein